MDVALTRDAQGLDDGHVCLIAVEDVPYRTEAGHREPLGGHDGRLSTQLGDVGSSSITTSSVAPQPAASMRRAAVADTKPSEP